MIFAKQNAPMTKKLNYDYVVIEGNIGTGKTSLAERISADYQTRLVLERFADNPFLPLFYEQPQRYSFPLELSFLADRYQQLNAELSTHDLFHQQTVADYLLSKSLIFANITLKNDENTLYQRLFHIINPHLPKPDLLVYLHKDVSQLMKNIARRGRSYEQNIRPEYLADLEKGYWDFFKQQEGMRILVLDTNEIDYVGNPAHYEQVLDLMNKDYATGIHRAFLKP